MFLEAFGKLCFAKMRPPFFFLLISTPILLIATYLGIQWLHLNELQERFTYACQKGKIALEKKAQKDRFLHRYSHPNLYFLDQQIESLSFLQGEQTQLQALLHHPALADKRAIEARLAFLSSDENRISFTEEAIRSSPHLKETEEKQRRPVQMDEEDLKNLLALIEDLSIDSYLPAEDRPQLIISDFHLKKKETPLKTEVLEIEMDLLKREFTQP